jgi:hypothetical protein
MLPSLCALTTIVPAGFDDKYLNLVQNDASEFESIPLDLKQNPDFVREALRVNGNIIQYISEAFRDNAELVKIASVSASNALHWAGPVSRANIDVVVFAVKQFGDAFLHVRGELQKDERVRLAAATAKHNPALQFVPSSMDVFLEHIDKKLLPINVDHAVVDCDAVNRIEEDFVELDLVLFRVLRNSGAFAGLFPTAEGDEDIEGRKMLVEKIAEYLPGRLSGNLNLARELEEARRVSTEIRKILYNPERNPCVVRAFEYDFPAAKRVRTGVSV